MRMFYGVLLNKTWNGLCEEGFKKEVKMAKYEPVRSIFDQQSIVTTIRRQALRSFNMVAFNSQ